MYIRGLIPWNSAELADAVPIALYKPKYGPRCEKPWFSCMQTTMTQASLRMHAVQQAPLLLLSCKYDS